MLDVQTLNIELNEAPFKSVVANLNENGRRIRIYITNNGAPMNLEGVMVYLYAMKSDGSKIFNEVVIEDVKDGIVLAKLTKQMVSLVGTVKLTLLMIKDDVRICTKIFKLNVEESIVDDEYIESTDEFGALTEALGKVHDIDDKFDIIDAQFNTMEQKKADKTEVDIERKRLDNIIANNNNTEGNSELVDIRIGADGITYPSAGGAVREQFANNNTKIQQNTSKNTEQDTRLNNVEHKNKVQDVFLNGLLNENSDGRLSINGAGNELKLEGSKEGLVVVDNLTGDSLVNICTSYDPSKFGLVNASMPTDKTFKLLHGSDVNATGIKVFYGNHLYKPNTKYTLVVNILENTTGVKLGLSNVTSPILLPTSVNDKRFDNLTGVSTKLIETGDMLGSYGYDLYFGIWENGGDLSKHITFRYYILEGDYTNKPIPTQVFEGIQSTFEENKVTQEMVTAGTELVSNLGKYKVSAKVVGKNLFNHELVNNIEATSVSLTRKGNVFTIKGKKESTSEAFTPYSELFKIYLEKDKIYTFSFESDGVGGSSPGNDNVEMYWIKDKDATRSENIIQVGNVGKKKMVRIISCVDTGWYYGRFDVNKGDMTHIFWNLQVEEGTVDDPVYEPYFESTHNIYLNSPLLKGDILDCRSDGVYHVHNGCREVLDGSRNWNPNSVSGTVNNLRFSCIINNIKPYSALMTDRFVNQSGYTNDVEGIFMGGVNGLDFSLYIFKSKLETQDVAGIKKWLQANPTTVAYELAEPWEEKISDNKLLIEIANNSTLSVDSNIPCASVKATYTSNVVSVVKLDKIQYQQDQVSLDNAYKLTVLEIQAGITI